MTAGSPFWTFSLGTYARPGAAEACLELQETAGADVNVLLYLLWLAAQGRRLGRDEVTGVAAMTEAWRRGVVATLRQARRVSKQAPEGFDASAVAALRQQVKRAELEAERVQQEALYAWRPAEKIGVQDEPATAAMANIDLYARTLAVRFPEAPRDSLVSAALACLSPHGGATS